MSLHLPDLRHANQHILAVGNHPAIIQSILDFDFLSGKTEPSLTGIVTNGSKYAKFFWGRQELLIACYASIAQAQKAITADWLLSLVSSRRAYQVTEEFFTSFPQALGGHIFAEDVPEQFAIKLYQTYQKQGKIIVGPAGVGLLIPQYLKLGAIGGTDWHQIDRNQLNQAGHIAVVSASGGMVNELITLVANARHHISFALCFGGDRFPATMPTEAFQAAQNDPDTTHIIYYGELGGHDEYQLAELIQSGQITKPVIAYISGSIADTFDQPVQFGHAKALARLPDETAKAKKQALQQAGAIVVEAITDIPTHLGKPPSSQEMVNATNLDNRRHSLFTSTISQETAQGYAFAGQTLEQWAQQGNLTRQILAGLLGRVPTSHHLVEIVTTIFILTVDHGPQVSGALNTMITARAGKNMVDALAAGLLTIGPRFGGAVNDAAQLWHQAVVGQQTAQALVEQQSALHQNIAGIGHKKYRVGVPDPRIEQLQAYVKLLKNHPHLDVAQQVEQITTAKKGNLILNIDGFIAALLLDILAEQEQLDSDQLQELIDIEFFNALFIIPRTAGLISHYLDQKRLDEGLFRLPDDQVLLSD